MVGKAIISVYDKEGLESFAKGLAESGIQILSTGGTARFLEEKEIAVEQVSDYTGHPEILGGRVKSLHPKIHGGILVRREREDDLEELKANDISPIDFVVVNLYPFVDKVFQVEKAKNPNHESLVEDIDIGGPTLIRAAAKNCKDVVVICDPADYKGVLEELKAGGVSLETRQRLAAKVFRTMAAYDASVARYFSLGEKLLDETGARKELAPVEGVVLEQKTSLRYGENPHQAAALYGQVQVGSSQEVSPWTQLQGKELSYNNMLDFQAAVDLFLELEADLRGKHAAVVIKHLNPCGAALRGTPLDAFVAARDCDSTSAFGGIVALSGELDKTLAETILEGFVEVVAAAEISEEARAVFQKKKNVRLMLCDFGELRRRNAVHNVSIRNFYGDYLAQTVDGELAEIIQEKVVSGGTPSEAILSDLAFAWKVSKHVKSNTIVIAKDGQAIGVGAGQMSRVDAAKIAIKRAEEHGFSVQGAVAASDAFLPFPDTLEILNDAGVVGLVQPGGSIKDKDVIATAEQRKVVMVFTGERHFKH